MVFVSCATTQQECSLSDFIASPADQSNFMKGEAVLNRFVSQPVITDDLLNATKTLLQDVAADYSDSDSNPIMMFCKYQSVIGINAAAYSIEGKLGAVAELIENKDDYGLPFERAFYSQPVIDFLSSALL